jgi:2-octaprenylphenol hydroxylase
VSAIATGSADILDAAGAWDHVISTRACPYEHMRVWDEADEADGPSTLRFDADEFGIAQLGFIVENLLVQDALLKVLDRTDVTLRFASPIAGIERDGERYRLDLEDRRQVNADLVIAADGAHSFVRDAAGIEIEEWPYAQTAFVTHLVPGISHGGTARQRFLADGPLGMLPLADGRISVVWSMTPAAAEHALAASADELGEMLTAASDRVLGVLEPAGPRGVFPLCARHARHYVLPRLALIGDAAHAVHPLAGQGANLGLQDAWTLSKTIEEAITSGEHPGDRPVLRRYERARKGANATMLHFMTGLNRLFGSDSPLLGELRRAGMRLFNASGPVRERAVRVALGGRRR